MATEYNKDDYSLREWERKIDEEDARWRHLGISLDQMRYSGTELFALQAKLQALTNCVLQGDTSEESMMLNLKMIIYSSMEEMREQVERAKLVDDMQQPKVVLPWQRGGNNA